MKIFHLGDLHLGKSIYGRSMIEDQAFWIERFIELCKEKKPDVVLVAGDVYDRASPAAEAVKLLDRFITGVTDLGIKILIVAGNHDSGEKISFAADLLKREGVAGHFLSPISGILTEAYTQGESELDNSQ